MITANNASPHDTGLAAALAYAARGWPVFPCHTAQGSNCSCGNIDCEHQGKHPRTAHGVKDATTDLATVTAWWRRWPDANVAIATGAASGLVVLDIDPRNGGNVSLELLESAHGPLPVTLESLTGGGGRHLLFAHPGGTIKNSNGVLSAGLDVKADGGYIIAPPSFHPSGQRYEWEVLHAFDNFPLASLPDWLVQKLASKPRAPSNGNAHSHYSEEKRTAILIELCDALRVIPAVDFGIWLKVGMGLHAVDAGDLGFELFDSWSQKCKEKYTREACQNHWKSFTLREDGITEKTIFDLAIQYGWRAKTDETQDSKTNGSSARTESPRPLRRQLSEATPYPVDHLLTLAPVAKRLHAVIQAPLALCGQSVLAATSLAVQGHADIHIDGRVLPLSEYFITVGESGERKTAVDREALRPHREYEKMLAEQYEQDRQNYENDLAAYKKARDEALKKAKTREEKKKALDAIGPAPLEPLMPVLSTEEPTYEGLIKLLQHGHPSLGLFADEGGRFIGGYGMSDEHQLKTAAGLSELWDGKRVSRVRGGDGAALLYGRRVALHLMAQPEVAQRVLSNPLLIDQGLMSRCLVTWPESTAGTRSYNETNLREDHDLRIYSQRITDILKSPLPLAEGKRNELSPRHLPLSAEAKALWIRFHNAVETRLADNQPFSSIRGFANKAAEHALRPAGTLTLYSDLQAVEIATEAMKAGIALAQHYLDEALRLFHASHTDPDLLLAENLLAWAQQRGKQHLPLVDIYQRGLNAIRDVATARRLVKILEAHGWFVPIPGGMDVDGQFRREVWEVKQKEEE